MDQKLERDVRYLKIYAVLTTIALLGFLYTTIRSQSHVTRFGEIDVERINVVEPDGTLRMVISDQEHQHPGIINGEVIQRDEPRPPGIIFFNQVGDEMGGLIFGANGEKGHFGSLTFDKVGNDQALGFRYLEGDNGQYAAGIQVWQIPDIPLNDELRLMDSVRAIQDDTARKAALQTLLDEHKLPASRLYVGKGRNDVAILELADIKGNPRLRLSVAADGVSSLEFLDESGQVTYSLPDHNQTGNP